MHDSETAAVGQQVITACAFIHKVDKRHIKVFMARRAGTKKFLPDEYELPGGHIDYGEDIKDGLAREVKEEFNMDVSIGDPFAVFTYMNDIKGSQSVEIIYFAHFISDESKIETNADDHSEFGWYKQAELANLASKVKPTNDAEFQSILTGFHLLAGANMNCGDPEHIK